MADREFKEGHPDSSGGAGGGDQEESQQDPSGSTSLPDAQEVPENPASIDQGEGDDKGEAGAGQGLVASESEDRASVSWDAKEGEKGSDREGGDDAAPEDLGLSITDDELWDEGGGLDEIPLFDELEKEEPGQEREEEDDPTTDDRGSITPEGTETEDTDARSSEDAALVEDDPSESGVPEEEQSGEATHETPLFTYLPFVFSGLNIVLFVAGLVFLVNLLSTPQVSSFKTSKHRDAGFKPVVSHEEKAVTAAQEVAGRDGQGPKINFYTMTLDPFIIPAQLNGELVFFKLKAELVFDDVASKRVFSEREATLRDIIYSELKGIDISSGLSNKNLFSYRRPIMERLNESFSPHRVKDVRLIGFILK